MDNMTFGNQKFKIENGILKGQEVSVDVGDADVGKEVLQTLINNPDFVCLIDAVTGEECTFKRMADESVKCALWLRKEGMKLGDAVCVFTHNHLNTYIPCLATLFNRGILCPSFSGHTIENLQYILELIKPKFIFANEREAILIDKIVNDKKWNIKIVTFEKIEKFITIEEICDEKLINTCEINEFSCIKPNSSDDSCFLIFTSGSSGEPKPTLHLYRSVMNTMLTCLKIKNSERNISLNSSPLGWVTGTVNTILDPLSFSKKIIIHEKGHEPEEIFKFIEKYKVTNLVLGLDMIYKCYKVKNWRDYDLSSIKRMSIGGTKLNTKVIEFFQEIFPNGNIQFGYGSTELLLIAFKTLINKENLETCGFIIPGVQVKVINPQNGNILQPNETGELCFKTPFMMKEYYNNPEATKIAIDDEGNGKGIIGYDKISRHKET
ncbi:uncharacterized protein LOC127281378 isoform X2 [Leptopilina boulardi]|uniref:uncharacterized protein LOC127281378 isoform X2 n=1 Tax=Leptopilina boulardi TaxID=63433 RepID=UPI0021F67CD7|nr:uncharacterized protein LOC127281378 isoform X2 [Leptopilina boulardi]